MRVNGKLLFAYCGKCALKREQGVCTHPDTERDLEGTWTTIELEEALKNGYVIMETYEVSIIQLKTHVLNPSQGASLRSLGSNENGQGWKDSGNRNIHSLHEQVSRTQDR